MNALKIDPIILSEKEYQDFFQSLCNPAPEVRKIRENILNSFGEIVPTESGDGFCITGLTFDLNKEDDSCIFKGEIKYPNIINRAKKRDKSFGKNDYQQMSLCVKGEFKNKKCFKDSLEKMDNMNLVKVENNIDSCQSQAA
ncbi:hypothetical protein EII17_08865 [Clostridiales bacterium COT073_COT-073]|nr:hypothetical protein EII17_08865 [Clostridiales bacterium COT073_COT-073]